MKDTLPQNRSNQSPAIRSSRQAVAPPPAIHTLSRKWLPGLLILMLSTAIASARPRPPMPPYPEQSLNSWRFDGTSWLTNTRTGPLVYDNLQLVESWSGHALQMTGPSGLLALPNNQPDGTPNFTLAEGTIRLWFAPDWTSQPDGTGPGAVSRLFEVGAWSATSAQGWWSLAISPDGTLLGFLAQDANGQTQLLQAPIRWQAGEWHQIALSWSAQETVLFLDGLRIAIGPAVSLSPFTSFSGIQGFCIGSDVHGGQLAGGRFEEVFTFDRASSDLDLAADYARTAPLAALGPITVEEEQAMIAAAVLNSSTLSAEALTSLAGDTCALAIEIGRPVGSQVPITIHNTENRTYWLWAASDLTTPNWTAIQTLQGSAFTTEIRTTVLLTGAHQFFRVTEDSAYSATANSFAGMNWYNTDVIPPDTMGAIGPNHFVEVLNNRIAVFDRHNPENNESQDSRTFFGLPVSGNDNVYDPRVLYDASAGRWVVSAIYTKGTRMLLVGRSQDSNPSLTGNWRKEIIDVVWDFSLMTVNSASGLP